MEQWSRISVLQWSGEHAGALSLFQMPTNGYKWNDAFTVSYWIISMLCVQGSTGTTSFSRTEVRNTSRKNRLCLSFARYGALDQWTWPGTHPLVVAKLIKHAVSRSKQPMGLHAKKRMQRFLLIHFYKYESDAVLKVSFFEFVAPDRYIPANLESTELSCRAPRPLPTCRALEPTQRIASPHWISHWPEHRSKQAVWCQKSSKE